MAVNKLMHPRNIYSKKPDFKLLAQTYPEFRKHAIQDLQGRVHLDFKKPECLRALTWALLRHDWGLDVFLPPDRLVPTIPLRLNYILWLEDILAGETDVKGIDIGTGASCVYPLLASKKNGWKFLASESDEGSFKHATENVEKNDLLTSVKVVKVDKGSGLYDLLTSDDQNLKYTFCMCNPPFFASNLEAWGMLSTRSEDRPEPPGVSTGSPAESVCPGGEVEFVRRMIEDSVALKDRVRIYTTMLGKKTSLVPLKEELRNHKITNFGVTEFCQGRTMRWGLGWTFDPSVTFPTPPSKRLKQGKPKPPIVYKIPRQMSSQPDLEYNVPDIGSQVMAMLDQLKIIHEPEKSTPEILEIQMVAIENTWSHQRRKRRRDQRINTSPKQPCLEPVTTPATESATGQEEISSSGSNQVAQNGPASSSNDNDSSVKEEQESSDTRTVEGVRVSEEEARRLDMSVDNIDSYIVKCRLVVRKSESDVQLEMTWQDGDSVELMHQIMQYFKNRFK